MSQTWANAGFCGFGGGRSGMPIAFAPLYLAEARRERCRVRSAVEQNVLTGDVAGMDAAQKSTGLPELRGSAESLGGNLRHGLRGRRGLWFPGFLGGIGEAVAQALGVETARQQIIDGDVLVREFAGHSGPASSEG